MKKVLIALLAVSLLFGLTGCENPNVDGKSFSIVGEWEYVEHFEYNFYNLEIQDIVKRYTFNADNTFILFLMQDDTSESTENTFRQYLSYCYRGTYTVDNGIVILNYEEDKISHSNGLTWRDTDPNISLFSNDYYIEDNKLFVKEYNTVNSMEDKSDPVIYELKRADTNDPAVTGMWSAENDKYRLKLNADMTFEFGAKSDSYTSQYGSDTVYGKGTYIIIKNPATGAKFLFLSPTHGTIDYPVWEAVPEDEVETVMEHFTTRTRYLTGTDSLTLIESGDTEDDLEIEYTKSSVSSVKWE